MKADENLSKLFGIEKIKQGELISTGNEIIPGNSKVEQNIDTDYEISRSNLHKLLNQGQDALYSALEIAKQSEHPRAFEVCGNLMKQLADINEQLLKLSEKKIKLDIPALVKGKEATQVTNNNAIFVGSTSELGNLINKMNRGE